MVAVLFLDFFRLDQARERNMARALQVIQNGPKDNLFQPVGIHILEFWRDLEVNLLP